MSFQLSPTAVVHWNCDKGKYYFLKFTANNNVFYTPLAFIAKIAPFLLLLDSI